MAEDAYQQWWQVEEIFAQALDLPVDAREAFLDEACKEDGALRRQVQRLLDAQQAAHDFLEEPAAWMEAPFLPGLDAEKQTDERRLSNERWHQVEALLDEAFDLEPEAQAALLDEACADDPDLRQAVERLLAADARDPTFLKNRAIEYAVPLIDALPDDAGRPQGASASVAGQRIGAYRLLKQIGEGGMGTVFLAERADGQFRQRVALKLLRKGFEDQHALRRFRFEREILARLQHPNIALLLDGGVTEAGQPYFIMQYIDGEPIDRYCDGRALSIQDRLALFEKVCEAVRYAHQNLIVHRDLKPSNILVTDDGTVKLLDFGIAKLLDEAAESFTIPITQTGRPLMTPAYASPEQVQGALITTATDVYALGVVLYELLTGRRPYQLPSRLQHEVARIILEEEPERPSSVVRRVETIPQADGTTQTLTPEAISQARGTSRERLTRRLAGDLDNIVMKALRKEPARRYPSAEAMLTDVHRYARGEPVSARRSTVGYRLRKFVQRHRWGVAAATAFLVLLAGFSAFYTIRVTTERNRVQQEAEKSAQVTDFLLGLFEANDPREAGGDTVTARELLERGLEHVETLDDQPAVQAQMLDVLGRVYRSLGEYEQAQTLLERAVAMRRRLLGPAHPDLALTINTLALVLKDRGDYDDAEPLFREALAMRQQVLEPEHLDVAKSLNSLGTILDDRGDYDAADSLFRAALAMRRKLLGDEHPDVAESLNNLGLLRMEQGDYDEAEAMHREALTMRRQLFGAEHLDITYSLNNLALVLHNRGDYDEAEPLYQELVAMDRKLLGARHPDVALDLNNLGGLMADRGEYEQAEALHREALSIYREALGEEHPRVAQSLNNLAGLLHRKGDYEAAEPLYREALAVRRKLLGDQHPAVATTLNNLGTLLLAQGDPGRAEPLIQEALAMRRERLGDRHPSVAGSLNSLASLFMDKGDPAAAEPLYREAVAIYTEAAGETHWVTAYYTSGLAACLTAQARYEEAEPLLLQAYPIVREERGDAHTYTQRIQEHLAALYSAWGKPEQAAAYQTEASD